MFEGRTCLITGGTGSWGHELTRKLLQHPEPPAKIRIFSRNEFSQVMMQRLFGENAPLEFVIGDIRDYESVREACRGVDYVFHLAALKHVPICERQPNEALKTNVTGTNHLIRASIEEGVQKVIDVSTDKAVSPINFYGITKAIGEKLIIHANSFSERTKFVCIRGGNVLGTNGSVVPLFLQQLRDRGEVTLTDERMTRFFLTVSEAIDLLLTATEASVGGETFVMKMKSCRVYDIARVLAKSLNKTDFGVREIGIRPGEKLHEVLVSHEESQYTYELSPHYYVILPQSGFSDLHDSYQGLPRVIFDEYHSNMDLLDVQAVTELLRKGGFIP